MTKEPKEIPVVTISELEEIRATLDRASKDESWSAVTEAWQLTQNLIWKIRGIEK